MALKDLLRTADLTGDDLAQVLERAAAYKAAPVRDIGLLAGRTVVHHFAKPSTRTRLSLQTAVAHLGGTPLVVGGNELQLDRGETIEDTARVLSRYAEAFTIRTYSDDDVARFAAAASIPVVNALTDGHHPLQSLADLLTLQERFGDLAGRSLVYLGDGNNVTHSLMEAGALAGMRVVAACPDGYRPDPAVVAAAEVIAARTGGAVEVTDDPVAAADGADALYADVWLSMGDPDDERDARLAAFAPYRVTGALLDRARPGAVFLHCLPAHRGEEVTAEVIDGERSVVFEQAENRLHTAQAVLALLVSGTLSGAASPPTSHPGG
ncbi:MAG: ornithine carbamoyltransferase [Acidimicrobiales bacterium]|jgi:ornithine carbamoyltransferase|nr:ornithine carbamoyltransferase [Acidimicrobiales bacterium]